MPFEISFPPSAASFRDPAGCLVSWRGRILRAVNAAAMADLNAFLESKAARKHLEAGSVAGTRLLSAEEAASLRADPAVAPLLEAFAGGGIAEHERVPFPSFPY